DAGVAEALAGDQDLIRRKRIDVRDRRADGDAPDGAAETDVPRGPEIDVVRLGLVLLLRAAAARLRIGRADQHDRDRQAPHGAHGQRLPLVRLRTSIPPLPAALAPSILTSGRVTVGRGRA